MAMSKDEGPSPTVEQEREEEEYVENGNGERIGGDEEDGGDNDKPTEEDEYEEEEESYGGGDPVAIQREKINKLAQRISVGPVRVRVHDVVIKGNTKTKDSLIEAEVLDAFKNASTIQEILQAAQIAKERLQQLDIFESATIKLEAGPSELPDTANIVIEIVEPKVPLSGDVGFYSKPEARGWSLEGSLKYKNLIGYGDIWDASGAYGGEHTTELSAGLSLPRFKAISTPLTARISLLSQDWLKFSSYKESLFGLSIGLLSTRRHGLDCNLTWRSLTDPSRMSSKSIRRQLGHNLLSSLKYSYKIDERDSHLRPTRGYAFLSTSQIGGLGLDSKSLRFIRQEFDLRGALPLGFFNSALNVGFSAGVIFPWGGGFTRLASPLPDRFFMGGHSSPVSTLGKVGSVLGFKTRGFGPTDARRLVPSNEGPRDPQERDALGGDLAVSAFADLSFNLPLRILRDAGVHGHAFVTVGNVTKLTEGEYRNFSIQKFVQKFRSSVGLGVVLPLKLFRMEINYCYILKQFEHDGGKTGVQFSFSSR